MLIRRSPSHLQRGEVISIDTAQSSQNPAQLADRNNEIGKDVCTASQTTQKKTADADKTRINWNPSISHHSFTTISRRQVLECGDEVKWSHRFHGGRFSRFERLSGRGLKRQSGWLYFLMSSSIRSCNAGLSIFSIRLKTVSNSVEAPDSISGCAALMIAWAAST